MPQSGTDSYKMTVSQAISTPNGEWIITGDRHGRVTIWNSANGSLEKSLETKYGSPIYRLAASPDGEKILVASEDWVISCFNIHTSEELYRWEDPDNLITQAIFSNDNHRAYVCGIVDKVFLWDIEKNVLISTIVGPWPRGELNNVQLSPDGAQLLGVYGRDGYAHVWDTKTGCLIGLIQNPYIPAITGIGYSPDGRYIFTVGGKIALWDAHNGERVKTIDSIPDASGGAFSRDGQFIAVKGEQQQVLLVDIETGDMAQRFVGHTSLIYQMYFMPNGTQLLTCSADGTARLWDIETGRELMQMSIQKA